MKKILYSLPEDLIILWGFYLVATVICKIADNNILLHIYLAYAAVILIYLLINKWSSNRGERRCKYLTYWNIWGNKNNVFIAMHNSKCKANEGDAEPGKTEMDKFENELKYACKYLSGAKCSTCTHAKYYYAIRNIDRDCTKKKAYKGTLKKVRKFLGMKDDGKKRQFYCVKFKMP